MNLFAKLSYLNIFRKFFIFIKYLSDNLANGELSLVWISFKYLIAKKSNSSDKVIKTNIGLFHIRKNTIDFKLANSAYEFMVLKKFQELVTQYNLFIDVGANIGTYSIIAAKQGIRSIAFEPILENFKSFEKNINLNHLNELIKPFNYGLSDKKALTNFYYDPLKPGASGINPIKRKGDMIEVRLKVFDEIVLKEMLEATNIFIKIDVEGMELEAIRGMRKTLNGSKHACLIIETKHAGEQYIKNLLNELGDFQFEKIDEFNMLATKTA